MIRSNVRLPVVSHRVPVSVQQYVWETHVIKYVKHLDVANAVKGHTVVNENYERSFTH